jgi:hypothetical protein
MRPPKVHYTVDEKQRQCVLIEAHMMRRCRDDAFNVSILDDSRHFRDGLKPGQQ